MSVCVSEISLGRAGLQIPDRLPRLKWIGENKKQMSLFVFISFISSI